MGADLSLGMARESAAHAEATVVADAVQLPFADAAFDVALALHMLYHVPRHIAAIGELRRIVRPGGALLAATNGRRHTEEITTVINAASHAVTGRGWTPPVLSFTVETAPAALRSAYDDVRRVEWVETVPVPSVGTVLEYLASFEPEHCGMQPGAQWAAFLAAAEDIVADRLQRHGTFTVTSHTGMFVCR
jgi:SAM-dependent methyltransferase